MIVAFITTQGAADSDVDLVVESSTPSFARTGLKARSIIKLDKVVTIEKAVLLGELGEMSAALMLQADEKLRYALNLSDTRKRVEDAIGD